LDLAILRVDLLNNNKTVGRNMYATLQATALIRRVVENELIVAGWFMSLLCSNAPWSRTTATGYAARHR
jgi:hypothetical protein